MLKLHSPSPENYWKIYDKNGKPVIIEQIMSGNLMENYAVFHKAFTELYADHPKVMEQALENFKSLDEFLKFAFEEWERKNFEAKKPNNYFVRAAKEGKPIGYMSFEVKNNKAFIRNLAIDPACKGMGIGKELTAAVFKIRPDISKATLLVSRSNLPAIGFYKHLGFVEKIPDPMPEFFDSSTWMGMEMTQFDGI